MPETTIAPDFWTSETSVFFTSFWGWSPETWATVGWSNEKGLSRRDNLLKDLSDPFIAVCYVTKSGGPNSIDPDLRGRLAGYYLVSHETGDRDQFTHPIHHDRSPEQWRHSVRALRAFSYLPEYRIRADEFYPGLASHARSIASMGEVITDQGRIASLRNAPAMEVEIYVPSTSTPSQKQGQHQSTNGWVNAGPTNKDGYVVAGSSETLPTHLYALRLLGDSTAFLGYASEGRCIYKIGVSASPDLRRQQFQKALPEGAFRWELFKTTAEYGSGIRLSFEAAVRGEYAMKRRLADAGVWLGGEFYLASNNCIECAWQDGLSAARSE